MDDPISYALDHLFVLQFHLIVFEYLHDGISALLIIALPNVNHTDVNYR